MKLERIIKPAFVVIGREGSTEEGEGFFRRLWAEANARFEEIAPLAKRDEQGAFVGFWGAMTDFSRSFQPWEDDFSRGLYLAGAECTDDAVAPEGWTRWDVPGFEYLRAECETGNTFREVLEYLDCNGLPLVGAVHDFTDPATGKNYMYFPLRRL